VEGYVKVTSAQAIIDRKEPGNSGEMRESIAVKGEGRQVRVVWLGWGGGGARSWPCKVIFSHLFLFVTGGNTRRGKTIPFCSHFTQKCAALIRELVDVFTQLKRMTPMKPRCNSRYAGSARCQCSLAALKCTDLPVKSRRIDSSTNTCQRVGDIYKS
jgi:hypothetical protein